MNETKPTVVHRVVRSLVVAGVGAVAGPIALLVFAYRAFHGDGSALTVAALTGAVVGGVFGLFVEDSEWRDLLDRW